MVRELGLRESKKEQTRRAIATSALHLFLERGFEAVSIAEIAEAAGYSKMTVFNYFPAKEDMFFEFIHGVMPDLGGAVRGRAAGEAPITALHRFVRAELERRAEWTALHDGVSEFTQMTIQSPTLVSGFDRIWREREQDLLAALADATGLDPAVDHDLTPLVDVLLKCGRAPSPQATTLQAAPQPPTPGTAPPKPGTATPKSSTATPDNATTSPSSAVVILHVVVAQIRSAIQTLVLVNQIRQAQGITADASADLSYAECDAAFTLLETGLASYGTLP
jgi:AcrR family transcriptional regulator